MNPRILARILTASALSAASLAAWADPGHGSKHDPKPDPAPRYVTLTGTLRDFRADGVNFEGPIRGELGGLVNTTLTGNVPTLTATGRSILNEANFNTWYTKATDLTSFSLKMKRNDSGGYTYTNDSFFPIDNRLLGNQGNAHNFHFTYQVSAFVDYVRGAGQSITLRADDDAWLYLDKKLGIDLGGEHPSASRTVNLDTFFAGRASGTYAFDLYYAERHTSGAVLSLETKGLTISPVPEPATCAMWLAGLGAMGGVVRRRRAVQPGGKLPARPDGLPRG